RRVLRAAGWAGGWRKGRPRLVDLPRATRANPGQATHGDSALPCTGGSDDGSVWGWLSPTVQTLAAVGALAYATMRVSLQYFYDSFGLTPESVGSNSATILAQSSLRVVEFGALFALVPVMLVLALFVAFDHW